MSERVDWETGDGSDGVEARSRFGKCRCWRIRSSSERISFSSSWTAGL